MASASLKSDTDVKIHSGNVYKDEYSTFVFIIINSHFLRVFLNFITYFGIQNNLIVKLHQY